MTGVEFDFVVCDSLKALEQYERIFPVERIEVTSFPKGQNEAVFSICGAHFHMLDENPEYQLVAPKPGNPQSFWFNIMVPDIRKVHRSAMDVGCSEVQPVTELSDYGVSNSMFADSLLNGREFEHHAYPFAIEPDTRSVEFVAVSEACRGKGATAALIRHIHSTGPAAPSSWRSPAPTPRQLICTGDWDTRNVCG